MKKNVLFSLICFSLAALSLLVPLIPSAEETKNLYDSVIRIHILAASDSPEDQARKLAVRDGIVSFARTHLGTYQNRAEAADSLREKLEQVREEARRVLRETGEEEEVEVTLQEEYYPTRTYDNSLSLPAGNYLSLCVRIGPAQGKNWWCVLFPPLCLSSATEAEDALLGAGMQEENVNTVLGKGKRYQYRFKVLELFETTRKNWKELF